MPATHVPAVSSWPCVHTHLPLFSVGLSHCVFLALSFLLDSPVHYSSSTHLSICIHHSSCISFIPSIQPFIHHPSTHPVIHPSSIHAFIQPSIYSSIHAASHLFIHPLSFQLTSTLHILVLSCFSSYIGLALFRVALSVQP